MSAYTQRPLTDDERSYAQNSLTFMRRFTRMGPMLSVWRLLFTIGVSTLLMLFLALNIFGQHPLIIGLAMLMGFTLGNNINRAWTRRTLQTQQEWDKEWTGQRERWEQVLQSGVMEELVTPVTEYVIVGAKHSTEEDCVCFIPVGESETLCLFTTELETEVLDSFPGSHLTVTRFPFPENVYQITCTGTAPAPLCTLKWSDFEGFSSPASFYGWLVHGKVYSLPLDRLEQGLISVE